MPRAKREIRFGDVLLLPFPFTDQRQIKQRPAVVVSSPAYHRNRIDLIVMAVSSQTRPDDTIGEVAVGHWRKARLLKPSVFKPLLATIERGLVRRKLGQLLEDDREALERVLDEILGE